MKKTKIVAGIFIVLIAVLLFSVSVYAAGTEYTYGKYKYTLTENDTVKITKYTGTSKTVTIPLMDDVDTDKQIRAITAVSLSDIPTRKITAKEIFQQYKMLIKNNYTGWANLQKAN